MSVFLSIYEIDAKSATTYTGERTERQTDLLADKQHTMLL